LFNSAAGSVEEGLLRPAEGKLALSNTGDRGGCLGFRAASRQNNKEELCLCV